MRPGLACGDEHTRPTLAPSVGWFVNEDGYTSAGVALALLVSLTLVFGAATAAWTLGRSNDVQDVADAAALSGANAVAAFSTVAQVADAVTLSMGIVGVVVVGVGLVLCCVPVVDSVGPSVVKAGRQMLSARQDFAKSAAKGLQTLERLLPAAIAANSASCVQANATGSVSYVGCAIPVPLTSKSDYSGLGEDPTTDETEDLSEKMAEKAAEAAEAKAQADEAKRRAWEADCGGTGHTLRERASRLAGLSGMRNPYYALGQWNFGVALSRARAYYAQRIAQERPKNQGIEEVTNSRARLAFYRYASRQLGSGHYRQNADGTCDLNFPSLPRNASEVRQTTLYTSREWPCSYEESGRVLHSTLECPGATGEAAGVASLADEEQGLVGHCDVCGMDVGDMGKVPQASTSIDNGFEYYWKIVAQEAVAYQKAKQKQVEAEKGTQDLAEQAFDLFDVAIEALSVQKVTLCPPGAYGCVAVVVRPEGTTAPSELTRAFLSEVELPAGAAVSAAVLAPDDATAENNVASRLVDGLASSDNLAGWLASKMAWLWGAALEGYGSAYGTVAGGVDSVLDGLDVLGGPGSWLKKKVSEVVAATGFEPADLRLRKPVITHTSNVLAKAGMETGTLEKAVRTLADTESALSMLTSLGVIVVTGGEGGTVTVAELTIPGTSITIPLTIDLSGMGAIT